MIANKARQKKLPIKRPVNRTDLLDLDRIRDIPAQRMGDRTIFNLFPIMVILEPWSSEWCIIYMQKVDARKYDNWIIHCFLFGKLSKNHFDAG